MRPLWGQLKRAIKICRLRLSSCLHLFTYACEIQDEFVHPIIHSFLHSNDVVLYYRRLGNMVIENKSCCSELAEQEKNKPCQTNQAVRDRTRWKCLDRDLVS